MIGVGIAAVIGLVVAGMFRAGMISFRYAWRQTTTLAAARNALDGKGSLYGLATAIQNASSVTSLSSTTLSVVPAGAATTQYYVVRAGTGPALVQTQLTVEQKVADGVSSLDAHYYNLDTAGRVVESTAANIAQFATVQITFQETNKSTFTFFTAGRLKNQ